MFGNVSWTKELIAEIIEKSSLNKSLVRVVLDCLKVGTHQDDLFALGADAVVFSPLKFMVLLV